MKPPFGVQSAIPCFKFVVGIVFLLIFMNDWVLYVLQHVIENFKYKTKQGRQGFLTFQQKAYSFH